MDKKYILITGGQLYNKGAQSMTFIAVNELKLRFPNYEIIVISGKDYNRSIEEKNNYNFLIYPNLFSYFFANGLYSKMKRYDKSEINEAKRILQNTEMMVDVSGYALGSNWPTISSIIYMQNIKVAKQFNISVYLMPQSFGPFNYKGIKKYYVNSLLKRYLKYPNVIFVRESEGYNTLSNMLSLSNIKKSPDLVLQSTEIQFRNIYRTIPTSNVQKISVPRSSVAVIPNAKNFKYIDENTLLKVYELIIKYLLDIGKKVFIVRHSYEDEEVCNLIKGLFNNNNDVHLLSDELSCFDYEELVQHFDYIIGSRYHSIIHAFKNGVPSIALGWATKYHELLNLFQQNDYIFDVRYEIDETKILDSLSLMENNYSKESSKIYNKLDQIKNNNLFNLIK